MSCIYLKQLTMNEEELKLIYILKVGYNSKDEGLYEFIFSKDETHIDIDSWGWEISPACDNATPPSEEFTDQVISLKTKSFDLFCLHEAVDREYMHGYHTIHALGYETIPEDDEDDEDEESFGGYESLMETKDDTPLLVFHYGMTLKEIKEMFYERKIVLNKSTFVETSSIKI